MNLSSAKEKIAELEQKNLIASGAVHQASLMKKRYQDALELLKKKDKELVNNIKHQKKMQHHMIEKEKMAALGGLVAGVAHEVNTPLGVAITSNSMAREECKKLKDSYLADELTEEAIVELFETLEQSVQIVESSLQRAAELVRSFKRISVDQNIDDKRRFLLYEYILDIIRTFYGQFKNRPIEILLDCDKKLMVETYPGSLSQIFNNLLQNALQYAFDDTKKGIININVELLKKKLKIIFVDNGIGMDESLRQHVFEPFVTLHREEGGSGLGLNIVYNIVTQRFGGKINVLSKPGQGVRYELTLKL